MLERKISEYLVQWGEKKRKKALFVTGAGQTGKTFSIRRFGKENYEVFIEINFKSDKKAADIFENVSVAYALIEKLTAYTGVGLKAGKTLIFLDEIQDCPKARDAVRLLVKDGRYDCIEAGLAKETRDYEEKYVLRPLDLEEFMYANGIKSDAIEYVRDCYEQKWAVSGSAHEMLKRIFVNYMVVGGMPEAVQVFVDTHDVHKAAEVHKQIWDLYRQSIDKSKKLYKNDKIKINKILDFIPQELNKANKRFLLADIRKSARMERYENSLNTLADMGITLPCFHVSKLKAPLKESEKRNLFKLYMADTGLLCAVYPENVRSGILQGSYEAAVESVLQNVFAQIFTSNDVEIRYFNEKNKGELDFVVENGEDIIPIAVRTKASSKSHATLDFVLENKEWEIKKGIVFYDGNVEKKGAVIYLPWYMAMFIK